MRCTATKRDIAQGAEVLNVGTLGVGRWANATRWCLGTARGSTCCMRGKRSSTHIVMITMTLRTVSGEDTCRSFSGASRAQTFCTACTVSDGHRALQVTRPVCWFKMADPRGDALSTQSFLAWALNRLVILLDETRGDLSPPPAPLSPWVPKPLQVRSK